MSRTTVAELATIYRAADSVADASVLQFIIDTASLLVTEELSTVVPAISVDRLKMIELYLAAHFAVNIFEAGGLARKKIDTVEEEYQRVSTLVKGLQSTRFGQLVITLDPTGRLGVLSVSATRAKFSVVSRTHTSTPTTME